ncbi:MAG: hypothetical protein N2712_06030 [Brevinematales bacterium]|nr:hypothetical protein [Brevinematales bacterium]
MRKNILHNIKNLILPNISLFCIIVILLFFYPNTLNSQMKEYFISQINDFIKFSTPFGNGFLFSTPKKLFYFDINSKKLTEIKGIENLLTDSVITSLASSSSYVFIGTTKGVLILNEKFSVVNEINQQKGLKDPNITSLYTDNKNLYIGTRSWGIYTYDYSKNFLNNTPISAVNGLVDNFIKDIRFQSFDKVVASSEGISIFDYVLYTYSGYSSSDYPTLSKSIMSIVCFGDNIYLGTSLGLMVFNKRLEQLRRLGYNSAVFSMDIIGKTLVMATYDGLVTFDTETDKYELARNEILRKPIASTISILNNMIFIGFDNKTGTFAVLEYQKPFLKIQNISYIGKNNIQASLHGYKLNSISTISVSLVSLNLGKIFNITPSINKSQDNITITFNTTNLIDDTYILNIDYVSEDTKETIKDIIVIRSKPPSISFSPVPLFHNQRKIDITGRAISSDVESIEAIINGRKEATSFDKNQNRILISIPLIEGSNNITFVYRDSFNNYSTNNLSVIVDTTQPKIISEDGTKIVEKNDRFNIKVQDPFIDKIIFSETISNLTETELKDGKDISFSIPNRNVKTLKVVAYDKAGNSSTKDFDVVFSSVPSEILIKDIPKQTFSQTLSTTIEFKGKFKTAIIYRQGIPVILVENPQTFLITNIQLENGINLIRVEGFLETGQVINTSTTVEYIPQIQLEQQTPKLQNQNINDEIFKLRKENEELKKKILELEETIKKISEVKPINKTEKVILPKNDINNIPSLIKVDYTPGIDSFSRISKRLYGSESFSLYFYYLLGKTSISKLVSEKGYIIAPNKKLMDILVKTDDITVFERVSILIEWWIMKDLGQPEKIQKIAEKMNIKTTGSKLISEKGFIISHDNYGNYIAVSVKK